MYYLYILQSLKDNSFYVGSTKNLVNRLKQHNQGKSKYSKTKRPWKIVYHEVYNTYAQAFQREKQIKSYKKRKIIENLIEAKIGTKVLGSIPRGGSK